MKTKRTFTLFLLFIFIGIALQAQKVKWIGEISIGFTKNQFIQEQPNIPDSDLNIKPGISINFEGGQELRLHKNIFLQYGLSYQKLKETEASYEVQITPISLPEPGQTYEFERFHFKSKTSASFIGIPVYLKLKSGKMKFILGLKQLFLVGSRRLTTFDLTETQINLTNDVRHFNTFERPLNIANTDAAIILGFSFDLTDSLALHSKIHLGYRENYYTFAGNDRFYLSHSRRIRQLSFGLNYYL